jgi:glycosyltransferase involved in cell wall biosynthesis
MTAPVVSVVTPFYNTERYLAEAIESVLAQTYTDFEYLLVDNRSTDGSLAIAQRYAARDPRIRVTTNRDFLDQDANFSGAMRQISPASRYCKLVLADDWILPRCLEEMVAVAEAHPSVGLVSSYYLKGSRLMGTGMPYPGPFMSGRDACRLQLLDNKFFFGSPTTVLFRADVVRGTTPFYDSSVPHADTEACYRSLRGCDFGFVHQVLSHLRVEETSRMGALENYFTGYLDRFIIIEKYGRDYLEPDEWAALRHRARRDYFLRLASALLSRSDPDVWRYHRNGLATIGYDLRWYKLWPELLAVVAEVVLNPLTTAQKIKLWLTR